MMEEARFPVGGLGVRPQEEPMGARILVADDSVTIQKVVELTFSKEDFVLTQARSGEEAIRKAKEMRPDLVLLDLVMPDMNGYDVCAALRTEPALRSVPIILLAGTFESFDQQRGAQAGANDVVTKPFESQVLVGKVKQLLFARSLEAAAAAAAPKPSADADTLKISSAPSGPVGPGVLQSLPVLPPLWAAAPPSAPIPPAAPETLSMDLGSLDLEPVALDASQLAPLSVDGETLPLPESLSLDDLLATGPPAPPAAPRLEVPEVETVWAEPVFELSDTDAPPLPMVEAGMGEPAALPVEDFLTPAPPAAADVTIVDLPQIDVTTPLEAITPAMTEQGPREPTSAEPGDEAPGLLLEEIPAPPEAPLIYQAAAPAVSAEIPPSILEEERPPSLLEAAESAAVATAMPASPVAAFVEDDTAPPALTPTASEVPQTLPLGVAETDMAAMREVVTERVAHDLRRELSEKLLDRFEKIVWEVVPDLAEMLITKEIERIRRLAEEEKSS
jgi:CheY-like chemotaxis protein